MHEGTEIKHEVVHQGCLKEMANIKGETSRRNARDDMRTRCTAAAGIPKRRQDTGNGREWSITVKWRQTREHTSVIGTREGNQGKGYWRTLRGVIRVTRKGEVKEQG